MTFATLIFEPRKGSGRSKVAVQRAITRQREWQDLAIGSINDDELVEVTPKIVRLRKRYLDPHERKRMARGA